jgi:hypothetical protein
MKKLSVLCIAFCVSATAFARGGMGSHGMGSLGMGSHHAYRAGEPFNTPGTNSLGTALSSSGTGNGQAKGPLLGTNAAIDREDAQVDKTVRSICRGC